MNNTISKADFERMVESWERIQPPLGRGGSATYKLLSSDGKRVLRSIRYIASEK